MIFDSIFYHIGRKCILDGIFLKIEPGKICGIFGRNGTGKSTLIKIGAGIILPTSGTVFIDGQAFLNKSRILRYKKISYLCQDTFLPKDLSVKKLTETYPIKNKNEFLYNNFNSKLVDQKIGDLSGGELRLVELILIITLNRPFILLDEPFTGIEPKIIEKMIELISQQRDKGKGILITDHYHHYISRIVDLAYLLKDSKCNFISNKSSLKVELQEHGYLK